VALEKAPQDRYASAQELAEDLRRWQDDRPIRARRPGLGQRQRRELAGKFVGVEDTWVRIWGLGEGYAGVFVRDRRGNLFQFAFADKAQHGRELLAFGKGEPIRLVGTVRQVEERYVLMVEEVRRR
jgi:hypothetical protein